jgi:hypothetical protein
MQLRKHKTAIAVNTTTAPTLLGTVGDGGGNAGEGISISPSPAPALQPEMLALRQRLEESERARDLQTAELAQMQAQRQRQQQQDISPEKQRFLNSHPEAAKQMDRLGQLHRDAIIAGLRDNSDEYFSYLERAAAAPAAPPIEPEPVPEPSPPPPATARDFSVSAPVRREAVSLDTGRPASYSTQIKLTPEQREHCKLSGIDEVTYARGVLRLEREKRAGTRQA